MRSLLCSRLVRTASMLALVAGLAAPRMSAKPAPDRAIRHRTLNLFASSGLLFQVNRQQCGLQSDGQTCVAFAGSPVGGGGQWPKGTPDQYIYNSGLQIAGHVSRSSGFAWAGDTVGAFFMDARGDQYSGTAAPGTAGWYNALNPADFNAWPNGAVVRNASDSIYNRLLEGARTISQGDAWARYWEGDPAFSTGRPHPSGLLVDQRALAWGFPSGNEDIIYFVFTFYNITARASSGVYNNPTIPSLNQTEIASYGDQFQDLNENKFKLDIPDGGYALDSLYAAFTMDADVAVFSQNYATAWLPFNIGGEYTGTFLPEVGWTFPPDIFGAPFFAAPGFIGVKYLKSPESSPGVEVGLTMFSQTLNSATSLRDPVGVNQLLRYLSGFLGPNDNGCTFTDLAQARLRRLCFLGQLQGDARFFEASGPFTLAPGQSASIVVAYINAAPVAVPGVSPGPTTDVKPYTPFTGDSIFNNPGDTVHIRTIDRMAGWVSEQDLNGNSIIEQDEVTTVPRSLLNKGLVAQAVFDHGFLLPNSPTAPEFYLVPGDGQVTLVWQKSTTETIGDPFFAVASDPSTPLFDPNFSQFDVEGYRIYRGRTSSDLKLVAQFDYAGTTFKDHTGAIAYGDADGDGKLECAPELGLQDDCPVTFDTLPPFAALNEVDLAGNIIQIPPGGRVVLAAGGTINLSADTAVTGGNSGFPALSNTGVPFAFVDQSVRNSFSYFYSVTAFDVNSLKSGPTSLESPRITKRITPRSSVPNFSTAELTFGVFGDDTVHLDGQALSWPIDATTGRFSGPPPPSGAAALAAAFAPLVPQLLPALDLSFQVDSVVPTSDVDCNGGADINAQDICYRLFVSYTRGTTTSSFNVAVFWPFSAAVFLEAPFNSVGLGAFPVFADSASAVNAGVPNGFAQFNASVQARLNQYILFSSMENTSGRRLLASVSPGGSRWFDGTDETLNHPTIGRRVGHVAGADTVFAPISHIDLDPATAGVQTDDNLWPIPFTNGGGAPPNTIRTNMQCFNYVVGALGVQSDIQMTWGAGGTVTSVRDVTDHVNVPFKPTPQASFGFVGDVNGNGMIDWQDFDELDGVAQHEANIGFCITPTGSALGHLVANPVIMPVSTNGGTSTGDPAAWASTGTGFGIYINGQRFIFQLTGGTPPAAGATWTLRSFAGVVRATTNADGLTPSGYSIHGQTATSAVPLGSPAIPGLRVVFKVTSPTQATPETDSILAHVHTLPDPYYVTNSLEITANQKVLKFVNLPPQAIIRIYSLSGVLVNVITHIDPGLGGEESWNLRNRNNQFVASGAYFYQVETPAGHKMVGRFTIVNFAP